MRIGAASLANAAGGSGVRRSCSARRVCKWRGFGRSGGGGPLLRFPVGIMGGRGDGFPCLGAWGGGGPYFNAGGGASKGVGCAAAAVLLRVTELPSMDGASPCTDWACFTRAHNDDTCGSSLWAITAKGMALSLTWRGISEGGASGSWKANCAAVRSRLIMAITRSTCSIMPTSPVSLPDLFK